MNKKIIRHFVTALASSFSLSACGEAPKHIEPGYPRPEDYIAVQNLAYQAPASAKSECLGRMQFDVQHPLEWPVNDEHNLANGPGFTHGINTYRIVGEGIQINGIEIKVFKPEIINSNLNNSEYNIGHSLENMSSLGLIGKTSTLKKLHSDLETVNDIYESRVERKKTDVDNYINLEEALADKNKSIKEIEEHIAYIEKNWREVDTGLPDSSAYWEEEQAKLDMSREKMKPPYVTYNAYVWRAPYMYIFTIKGAFPKADIEGKMQKVLKNFRARSLYEIPKEQGLCIPFGFIADQGDLSNKIGLSFRHPDALGVLYNIHLEYVPEGGFLGAGALESATRAGIGLFGGSQLAEYKATISQIIGPRGADIGGLASSEGGVAYKIQQKKNAIEEAYGVYTEFDGRMGSQVLPLIKLELATVPRGRYPLLTKNPPPFAESMSRYDAFKKSIRLRPTTPQMPELMVNK
ncbi:T6SS immunity protein Tli4 family protein [Iodobacter ciconiae]|uniref:Tle cognate immunity protein 4 C-terminal domain-containing protein n=1 Tax=Iodobacter ciconiae TaxID=2496266 RepID=A0A3S8ZP40_9NEIS|nr:T6SS immunity protein Tli4 family protein [Iodobacter ciconiae]AZN35246.1 hypothetical protein EJO50_01325 [Iodobacter ciconiae]